MVGRPQTRAKRDAARDADLKAIGVDPRVAPLPTDRRITPTEYSPALSGEVVALGGCGLSEAEMAAHLAVSLATFNHWRANHPEFREAMDRALTAAQAWWEAWPRRAVEAGDTRFAVGPWQASMRARFAGYGEKIEITGGFDVTSRLVVIDLRSPEEIARAEAAPVIEGDAVVIEP